MRTRRSVRNQNRLFKELFAPKAEKDNRTPLEIAESILKETIERGFATKRLLNQLKRDVERERFKAIAKR